MDNFEKRRDRFEFFESFEKPLLNICFELEVEDMRPYCKANGFPVFHFFLYQVFMALDESENFKYRIFEGEVIKIENLIASYTVIDDRNIFNFTRFDFDRNLQKFIENSQTARNEALSTLSLVNTGTDLSLRDLKNYVFITSIPWLRFTSLEHPVYRFKSADIPSLSWGKFTPAKGGKLLIPFSIQAHHGFVDAYHMYQLGESIKRRIHEAINQV